MAETALNNAEIYTKHLSEVNQNNKVKATENIYNQNGVLLVAKGLEITGLIAEKVAQHKLRKPVEHSVNIDEVVDANSLYVHINYLIKSRDDFTLVHESNKLDKPLKAACEYYSRYKILVQKITVLSIQKQVLFEQAILGAWFALAIAREMKNIDIDPREAFLIALIRDIGYLHLPASALAIKPTYSISEQNAIKSHPLVAKLILDELREIPNRLKVAVVEHHERCDGAGFPRGKIAEQLSSLGQVIAMADQMQYLAMSESNSKVLWLGNLTPFLNLNVSTHFRETNLATMKLIKNAQLSHKRAIEDKDMPVFICRLLATQKRYINLNDAISALLPTMNPATNKLEEKLIFSSSFRVQKILVESGVLSDEYSRWIQHVMDLKLQMAYEEMESIDLMYQELRKQFSQIVNNLGYFLDKSDVASNAENSAFKAHCDKIMTAYKAL